MSRQLRELQPFIQGAFVLLFIALLLQGRMQLFMVFFLGGLVLSFFSSRLFCGFFCPMGTVMRFETWAKKRLGWKDRPIPSWVQKGGLRWGVALVLLASIPLTLMGTVPLPVLPALLLLSIVLTLRYSEALFHRHICPYGFFLSFPARSAPVRMWIDADACTNCTACRKVCPSEAIHVEGRHVIDKAECLTCNACVSACRFDAIHFGKLKAPALGIPREARR